VLNRDRDTYENKKVSGRWERKEKDFKDEIVQKENNGIDRTTITKKET